MEFVDWLAAVRHTPRTPGIYAAVAALATVIAGVQFVRVRRRVKKLKLGRDGERVVGQYMERLREDGAQVFHDVLADAFNLDHVVISAKGIFVLRPRHGQSDNAKISVSSGQLFKDGQGMDPNPIDQVVGECKWLIQLLTESTGKKLPVFGVVAFPGWFVEPADESTKKLAWVLERKRYLRSWFKNRSAF